MGNGKESYVNHTWAMRAKGGLEEYRAPREVTSSLSDTWDGLEASECNRTV